ncbi:MULTISPECIES: DNA-binding transcriptional regulator [unclassified Azospirillum]|uniref:helix-turn-helix domain-containing protein n=1 Tax=unclassified Azospirillum TaxID=2630922 RepID=UPI00135A9B1B|nr:MULTISPECIES: hypothetical protein [unclassified Azospirillum]
MIDRGVDLVRLLVRHGMGLSKAHAVLNRIKAGEEVPVELPHVGDRAELLANLRDLKVDASIRGLPPVPDAKAVRERQGLTQQEFALKYALELATVRNWEQDRTRLSSSARILLCAIDTYPEMMQKLVEIGATDR